jgi:phosphatidylserine/phosphatidylglycerophosphate/cardiolipin synthase-like enzyme
LAFAKTEGFQRIIKKLASSVEDSAEIRALKDGIEVSSAIEAEAEAIAVSTLKTEVRLAEESNALKNAQNEQEKEVLQQRLRELETELEGLRVEAKKLPVRNLYVLDHPPLLQEAMLKTQRRMMIISPWIKAMVVNRDFVKRLEELLHKQVAVYIGYGISEEETRNLSSSDQKARETLRQLARKYNNFNFVRLGNTHAKVLIKDSDFAAVTSFNWLSFKGDPNRTFRDEQGILLQEPGLVDQKFNELIVRFDQVANLSSSDSPV